MVSCGRLGVASRGTCAGDDGSKGWEPRGISCVEMSTQTTAEANESLEQLRKDVKLIQSPKHSSYSSDLLVFFVSFFSRFFWFFSRTSFMSFMFIMSCVHTWLRVPCLQILTHLDSFSESMFHSVCDSLFLFNPR